ncbi:MAG: hypothetical protein JST00_03040 [Deltaproteobacteria bacterium]|nr:hypothetical protein [Deltaproteobacteria bacterium]
MVVGHRLILVVALGVAGASGGCSSCKRPPQKTDLPPDHLAPNEVVEGKEKAFGLPLPRVSEVKARFATTVHVTSSLTAEQLVNFVRARSKGGKATPGATTTLLEGVTPRDDEQKRLTIEIRPARASDGTKSEMIVRDTTPPPLEPGLSDDERFKRAGLKPDGTLLDPKHLQ